ncbi:hypothetical protein JXA63_04135 [Candidatus Woesebacteria bacterium]|nr:hypothetical protein [Candidatus Woesebacteria bacterium]
MRPPILSPILIAQTSINTYEDTDVATLVGLEAVFANIIRVVVGLGTIVLFIMLIVGGFNYMTAGGDPQKSAAAKRTLTSAIVGITIIASAYMIIRIIEAITGANLTLFRIEY